MVWKKTDVLEKNRQNKCLLQQLFLFMTAELSEQ